MVYVMRVNFSIALVCMVKTTVDDNNTIVSNSTISNDDGCVDNSKDIQAEEEVNTLINLIILW